MSTPTAEPDKEKPARKFPAPCWTQDEALALIEAYRERWYALRRGYLRTADWDAVAAAVTERCPDSSPPKTSAQCRHKMEKLRQRYRAEKQRSQSFPAGRFFSSWFFFENMDAMELGTTPGENRSNQQQQQPQPPPADSERKSKKAVPISVNHPDQDNTGGEYQINAMVYRNSSSRSKNNPRKPDLYYNSRVSNGNQMYMDVESDQSLDDSDDERYDDDDDDVGYRTRAQIDPNLAPPVLRAKRPKLGKGHGNYGGYDQEMAPPAQGGYRPNRSSKLNPNVVRFDSKSQRFRAKSDRYSSPNPPNSDPRSGYGFPSSFGSGSGKKRGDGGVKRDRGGGLADIVASIKMLGDGFMKMEAMKIEMSKDIEKMRMEMETKRNEMILESQRQIVDAFMTVLVENKKTKNANTSAVSLDS